MQNYNYLCVITKKYMIDTTVFQDKTAVYYTLGCKLNFSETSTIGKMLKKAGVRTARRGGHLCGQYLFGDGGGRQEVSSGHPSIDKEPSGSLCGGDRMLCPAQAGADCRY